MIEFVGAPATFSQIEMEIGSFDGGNISFLIAPTLEEPVMSVETGVEYEQFLADIWIGIVLTLMVLSCVCCMCSCLLYHKFQQWKRSVMEARTVANVEAGNPELELPSYTIASGLPSYEEALEQLKKVKESGVSKTNSDTWTPHTPPTPLPLGVNNLFQFYKHSDSESVTKPSL